MGNNWLRFLFWCLDGKDGFRVIKFFFFFFFFGGEGVVSFVMLYFLDKFDFKV